MKAIIIGGGSIGKRHSTNLNNLGIQTRIIDIDEINDDYLDEFDSDEFTHYTNIDVSGTEYGDNQMDYQFDERSSDEVSNTTTESGNTNQNDNSVNTNSNVPEEDLSTYKAEGGGSGKVDPVKKLNPNSKTKILVLFILDHHLEEYMEVQDIKH